MVGAQRGTGSTEEGIVGSSSLQLCNSDQQREEEARIILEREEK
jgi:hypothetical protein